MRNIENTLRVHMRFIALLLFSCVLFFVAALPAFAATVRTSPTSGSVAAGESISVSVVLASPDQAANAVSGVLTYPSDTLQLISLSKSGSVVGLWVQEPSFSNDAGQARFEGVILNPGYTGSGAVVITAKFKAKKEGAVSVGLSSVQVLANDGSGTDILTGSSGSTVTISPAVKTQQPEKPIPSKPEKEPAVELLQPPTIVVRTQRVPYEGQLQVTGTSRYPGMTVKLRIGTQVSDAEFNEEVSGARHFAALTAEDGSFAFAVASDTLRGAKILTARLEDSEGNTSAQSAPLSVEFEGQSLYSIVAQWVANIGLGFIVTLLLVLIVCILLFGVMRYRLLRRHVRRQLRTVDATLHKALLLLREDVEEFVDALEKEKKKRKLTTLESRFAKQMKQDLADTEKAVKKTIHQAEDVLD